MEQAAQAVFHESQIHELFSQETENLMQLAGQSESTNHRISRLLERIETSVEVFSTEIRRHEIDVQLVAINAQIAAARVPEAGALNRLAEETSRLSADTAGLTRAMSEQLAKTLSRLQGIRAEAKNVQDTVGQEKTAIARESVTVSEKLTRLNQRILRSSGEIARSFETAYQGVRDLLPRLRFPSLIDSAYGPAEMLCDSLVAATAKFGTDDLSADGHERLAQHTSRYTMQAERDAHAAALAMPSLADGDVAVAESAGSVDLFDSPPPGLTAEATPNPGAPAAPPVIAPDASNLGGGVELF
jgi:hypothetical protein